MKIFYLLISVLSLLLIGCSSTYKVSDFPSRDKFYEDFNKSASDKSLKIILDNDSTISADDGARISNDSLFITLPVLKQEKVINKDDIEDITVSIHDMTTTIVLKNDKSVTAGSIDILPGSSVAIYNFENTYKYLSLINVKEISYKNHWLGLPVPLISGTLIGVGLGILFVEVNDTFSSGSGSGSNFQSSSNSQRGADGYAFLGLSAIGIVGGSILGWINGWTYTYEFAP
ncbi:MAG: hypothetical protein WCA84_12370 [Ignavibacteriaceae bacterium]